VSAEDRRTAVKLVTEAVTSGARRAPACRILGITLRTLQRWETQAGREDRRRGPHSGPANTLSEEEREQVISIATSLEYRDLPPSQIVPRLADKGIYVASESSFYRILRHERLLAHRGKSAERRHHRPDAYRATEANQVWSWDITYLRAAVRGRFYYLYLIVDVWSRKIVGWAVHEREDSELAAVLIRQAAHREQIEPESLILHSDNGGPMKGATMLATLQWLGIVPSFSRPRVSDDNAFSEALFSTVKGRPEYPSKPFESLEAARAWVEEFVRWYNHEHLHSAIRFVSPADRHDGIEHEVLGLRKQVYEAARRHNPERWTRETRCWDPVEEVVLNRDQMNVKPDPQERKTA
jgi:transposase InsO family protein